MRKMDLEFVKIVRIFRRSHHATSSREFLKPIFITGGGRSGSTALMLLLGSDPCVAFDREYPFESRYLTYFAKFALSLDAPELVRYIQGDSLWDFWYVGFGGPVTEMPMPLVSSPLPRPELGEWIRSLWKQFSAAVYRELPGKRYYAEKAPLWLPEIIRRFLPSFTIYNVRDPRDVYLSANAFNKKHKQWGFGRSPGDTDIDHARNIALGFAMAFESYHAVRGCSDSLLVRYEDLVGDPYATTRRLEKWMGLRLANKISDEVLERHSTSRDVKSSVERWREKTLPAAVAGYFEAHVGQEMRSLGYPAVASPCTPSARQVSFAKGSLHLQGIQSSSHGSLELGQDRAAIHVTGNDFWILLPFEAFAAAEVNHVWISVAGEIGDVFSLYWRRDREASFAESRALHIPYSPLLNWAVLPLAVNRHPEWKGNIIHLRLDLFNSFKSSHHGTGYIRWVRLVR